MGNGGMIAFWVEGTLPSGPLHVKTTQAAPGGTFIGEQALTDGRPGRGAVRFAMNASGRAAVLFPLSSGGGTTLKLQLRTSSGTWGNPRQLREQRPIHQRRRHRGRRQGPRGGPLG